MKNCLSFPQVMIGCFTCIFIISSCNPEASLANDGWKQPTATPFQPLSSTPPPTFGQTPPTTDPVQEGGLQGQQVSPLSEPAKISLDSKTIWIDPLFPQALHTPEVLPSGWEFAPSADAALSIDYGEEQPLYWWIFALVAPFPFLHDGISWEDLLNTWQGKPASILVGRKIFMDESTAAALRWLWGNPADKIIQVMPTSDLLEKAWEKPADVAIIPFDQLQPRWKVLSIDGNSPIHKDFNEETYPLRVPLSIKGDETLVQVYLQELKEQSVQPIAATNRDASKLTVLAMTGVTALVRATAYAMEQQGVTYPGEDVGDLLRSADLTHISNEVPFSEACPYPNPVQADMHFCSDSRYIELLEYVGTDIVELTGDHFADWGVNSMYYTLKLYEDRGWLFYGGGYDISHGRMPITVEDHGNRLAFIGCNAKGGQFASAGEASPGSVFCDFSYMQAEIQRLRIEGYLPIATFQHFEYYTYYAQPNQVEDFRLLADAGAVIVSGSQAHQPQAMEFYNGSFIHYGLGNLFFDQYLLGEPTRQGFIDLHVFYEGRYISTELVTIYFVDFARPRLMTTDERIDLLGTVYFASDW